MFPCASRWILRCVITFAGFAATAHLPLGSVATAEESADGVLANAAPEPVALQVPAGLADEIRLLREQLDDLRRRDEEKERRIEQLHQQLRAIGRTSPGVQRVSAKTRQANPPSQERRVSSLERSIQESHRQQPEESPLDRAIRELQPQESPLDSAIRELERQQSPLDRAIQRLDVPQPQPLVSQQLGGLQFQLLDVSFDVLSAAGTSTERDESLGNLQGGGHDPRKRGFTLQNAELALMGAVDPYLTGETNIIYFIDPIEGETILELEEAFFTTQSLPQGLQFEGGTFFTEFGRINPLHPHAWHWQDQPIINSRLFGPDGIRGSGFRLGWLVPVEWFSQVHVGMQNAAGETMASFLANDEFFEERPIGGRPFVERDVRALNDLVYLARWENSWTYPDDQRTWLLGFSSLFGPNTTGSDGDTRILGMDLTMKWRAPDNNRGWPFVIWQSEFMMRRYRADNFFEVGDPIDPTDDLALAGDTLRDWGMYTQVLCGFTPRWAAGLRYEFVSGSGDSLDEDSNPISHNDDPFRDQRHRISPLIAFYPTEFARFRFQYNFDLAEHLDAKDAHSFWIGAEFLYGSHPAHSF